MSNLGLTHSNHQNVRISPQGMATMSPQMNMSQQQHGGLRLSPSHMGMQVSSSGNLSLAPQNLSLTPRQSPASTPGPPPPINGPAPISNTAIPQNLSTSPSNQHNYNHSNPTSPNCKQLPLSGKSTANVDLSADHSDTNPSPDLHVGGTNAGSAAKEGALNMSINTPSDMRTNSIATLRIKAKEHLDNINKGITLV